jgi:hypothetical protein
MSNVADQIREVCAGLMAFCLAARQQTVRMAGPST